MNFARISEPEAQFCRRMLFVSVLFPVLLGNGLNPAGFIVWMIRVHVGIQQEHEGAGKTEQSS